MSVHGRPDGVDQATGRSRARCRPAALLGRAARLLAAATVSVGSWGFAEPAASAAGQVLATGQVVQMRSPGVMALRRVSDGRLYANSTAVVITGIGFGPAAGSDSDGTLVTAAPGDELVFVASIGTQIIDGLDGGATETVVSGAAHAGLPHHLSLAPLVGDNGDLGYNWAVAIPKGAPASMVLDTGGFTQSFDLRAGRRTGAQPVALYRSVGNIDDTSVGASPNVSFQLTATGDPTGPVSIPVTLASVSLDYFPPSTLDQPPPPPDKAWLTVDLTLPASGYAGGDGTNDSFSAQYDPTLRLPDGTTVTGVLGAYSDLTAKPLTNQYEFEVPGDLTTATLIVAPGAVAATDVNGDAVTLAFSSQTAAISLPPAPVLAQGFVTPHSAPAGAAGAARANGGGGGGGLIAGIAGAIIVAAAVLGAALLRRRSRRWLKVTPVRHPTQRALLGAAVEAAIPAGWAAPGLPLPSPQLTARPVSAQPEQPPEQVDAATGTGPDGQDGPALVVRLLGPLQVQGLTRRVTRAEVRRLLVLLALADRPLDATALRDGLPDSRDHPPEPATVTSTASRLRKSTPEGVVPILAAGDRGYRLDLDRVEVDWRLFVDLTGRAAALEGPARLAMLISALRLVRGPVLTGDTWQGVDEDVRHIERAVETAAVDAARLALELRDARSAEAAISAGLRALPDLPVLWELRLVAAAGGSGIGLHRAWQQTQATLGPDASTLVPTYQRLAAGNF